MPPKARSLPARPRLLQQVRFNGNSTSLVDFSCQRNRYHTRANVADGSIASFERCRYVCFTPDSRHVTATQRTDALGPLGDKQEGVTHVGFSLLLRRYGWIALACQRTALSPVAQRTLYSTAGKHFAPGLNFPNRCKTL